ncbi:MULTISPECIES: DUF2975 domain-containing protein [Microbacterium]|uniref:DUF2975 domain-containing protein n=1 Tax=Microbacterium TaxID=33882 RepID=UPI00217F0886|nr:MULTISPECIES: DUF2975 domain-containing protein [Microbacterium]UWF78056.1 DUF2975 domain-containing protein [Microbacterium neungamense]WCM56234.1 DUF2975 domain-containing protein [Microbacterium sp. EF45047]
MGRLTILALRVVIALSLAGSVVVQAMILLAVWRDLDDAGVADVQKTVLIAIFALGVVTMQVFAVCIWQLLTLVRRGSVFSHAAFRYVDVIIGAIAAASVLAFALAALLAPGDVAPGIVGLICGVSLVLAGIALLVVVMRRLLVQAIERDAEARALRSELDEVV